MKKGNQTRGVSSVEDNEDEPRVFPVLKLDLFPPIFVLEVHLTDIEISIVEDQLHQAGASLTYDLKEARIVLGAIEKERRARFELRRGGVEFTEFPPKYESVAESTTENIIQARKRRFHDQQTKANKKHQPLDYGQNEDQTANESKSDTGWDTASVSLSEFSLPVSQTSPTPRWSLTDEAQDCPNAEAPPQNLSSILEVVNLRWLKNSIEHGRPEPFEPYTVLRVWRGPSSVDEASVSIAKAPSPTPGEKITLVTQANKSNDDFAEEIFQRAYQDPRPKLPRNHRRDRVKDEATRDFAGRSFAPSAKNRFQLSRPTHLLHETTSEHEEADECPLPPMPQWITDHLIYSCQRSTPFSSPNDEFIGLLQKIKHARLLTADDIGVRAYSTSIAALKAYPYKLTSPREILVLPGCDSKIATLYSEYRDNGIIRAAVDIDNDPILQVLGLFYEIWGVGATTAREYYYQNHWHDLDDIVINGWKSLSRVQQIGLKYYDEFRFRIPRPEVESIAEMVHSQAQTITDSQTQCIIVGGHRRGNLDSGDVDILITHPNEAFTLGLIDRIVEALEDSGEISHTLSKTLTNTHRGQRPLDVRPGNGGHGFDTLDKALVVWQKQDWPGKEHDISTNQAQNNLEIIHAEKAGREPKLIHVKNPNPHRRVDIIISPWKTIGCAVAGWTSGTTFQRDLRRYAKKTKGWKFDSSGVRDRATGKWIDLEGWKDPKTRCSSWREAERRVFVNMGLEFFEPWERCTG